MIKRVSDSLLISSGSLVELYFWISMQVSDITFIHVWNNNQDLFIKN
jgi:hypothetical protein